MGNTNQKNKLSPLYTKYNSTFENKIDKNNGKEIVNFEDLSCSKLFLKISSSRIKDDLNKLIEYIKINYNGIQIVFNDFIGMLLIDNNIATYNNYMYSNYIPSITYFITEILKLGHLVNLNKKYKYNGYNKTLLYILSSGMSYGDLIPLLDEYLHLELEDYKIDKNYVDKYGMTYIGYSLMKGHYKFAKYLFDNGFTAEMKMTRFSIYCNRKSEVRYELKKGATLMEIIGLLPISFERKLELFEHFELQ